MACIFFFVEITFQSHRHRLQLWIHRSIMVGSSLLVHKRDISGSCYCCILISELAWSLYKCAVF